MKDKNSGERKSLDTMMEKPEALKLLDGQEYTFRPLVFSDALNLIDKLNDINIIFPAVNLVNAENKKVLLEIVDKMFSYNHPEMTREKWIRIVDLGHIRRIIQIAIDLNELKK